MYKEKTRLDELLIELKYASNIKQSQSLILAGSILVNEQRITKVGTLVFNNSNIRIKEKKQFASRAAYKLKYVFEKFPIQIQNKLCVDIGASTGGFTEILYLNNAKKIIAIDVGYGQILPKLAKKKNIYIKDRFNAKHLSWKTLNESPQDIFFSIDVSFISLLDIFFVINKMKSEAKNINFEIVALIKPQFECDRGECPKGIVLSPKVHFKVLKKILKAIKFVYKGRIKGLLKSPIMGKSGNKEFLVYWTL